MFISYLFVFLQVVSFTVAGYANDPNVYELTPSNFDKVVRKTNYTTIVEFYAPWCGYCKQLEPIYKQLGKLVHQEGKYAVNVAAVDCDKDENKPLCSRYQVSGYPSLMVFRPPKYIVGDTKKPGRHVSETYNGERTLKAMWTFLQGRLKNYVKKFSTLKADGVQQWLDETDSDVDSRKKVLLITQSKAISPTLKSLAIDFLADYKFAMATATDIKAVTGLSFDINGKPVEIPVQESDKLPLLITYNDETGEFVKYPGTKKDKNNSKKISQWLVDQNNGKLPHEGQLSKKELKYYSKYRTGKATEKIVHDEL
ncbi:protein disulfide-isomerase Mpd1p [[Candida] anglica]